MKQAKMKIISGRPGRPEKYAAGDVLKTAMDLYWTEGVSTLSVNDLVRRMGIPKPSLYRHFPSEDSLQASVLLAYESTTLATLNGIMQQPALFSHQLKHLIEAFITGAKIHSRGCLLFQMREASDSLGPVARVACDEVFKRYRKDVENWIHSAARKGHVTLNTDSLTATHLFLGLITLIRNGFRDGLDEAGVRALADAHLAGIFQLNTPQVA
jgi:AcrR family transcriptional regulator